MGYELLNFIDRHSQYVGICNDILSKNFVNNKNIICKKIVNLQL